jgi:hypothetical protein
VVVSAGNSQTARVTTAVGSVSFTVTDAFTNPVGSQLVTFSAAGGGSPPASGTTNSSGVVTASGWTMGSTGTESGTGTFTNTLTGTAGSASGNATGFGIYTWSGDVAAIIGPTTSSCSGCHVWNRNPNNIVGVAAANPACAGVARIVASSAATSLIYQMVLAAPEPAPPCVGRMPPSAGLGSATSEPVKAIRAWINNGALNN